MPIEFRPELTNSDKDKLLADKIAALNAIKKVIYKKLEDLLSPIVERLRSAIANNTNISTREIESDDFKQKEVSCIAEVDITDIVEMRTAIFVDTLKICANILNCYTKSLSEDDPPDTSCPYVMNLTTIENNASRYIIDFTICPTAMLDHSDVLTLARATVSYKPHPLYVAQPVINKLTERIYDTLANDGYSPKLPKTFLSHLGTFWFTITVEQQNKSIKAKWTYTGEFFKKKSDALSNKVLSQITEKLSDNEPKNVAPMLQTYTIITKIGETTTGTFGVLAESADEAFHKVKADYKAGRLVSISTDAQNVKIAVVDAKGNTRINFAEL